MARKNNTKATVLESVRKARGAILECSFLLLLNNCFEMTGEDWDINNGMPAEIAAHKDLIYSYLTELKEILEGEEADRKSTIEKVGESRENLLEISAQILSMHERIIKMEMDCEDELFIREYEPDGSDTDYDELIRECRRFIAGEDVDEDIEDDDLTDYAKDLVLRATKVLSCFPVMMTRERFYEYLRNSFNTESDDHVREMSIALAGIKLRSGLINPPTTIERVREIGLTADEIEAEGYLSDEALDSIESLKRRNDELFDYLLVIFESYNYLLIMLEFADGFHDVHKDNIVIKDLYYTLRGGFSADEREMNKETLKEIFARECEIAVDKASDGIKFLDKAIDECQRGEADEEALIATSSCLMMSYIFNEDIRDAYIRFAAERDKAETTKEAVENFIDVIKDVSSAVTPKKARAIRRNVLRWIPTTLDPDELDEMMSHAFHSVSDAKQALIVKKVHEALCEYEFYGDDE